jgi:hypothetical protein
MTPDEARAVQEAHKDHDGGSNQGITCVETLHVEVPCLPHRLATAYLETQAKVSRVEALIEEMRATGVPWVLAAADEIEDALETDHSKRHRPSARSQAHRGERPIDADRGLDID